MRVLLAATVLAMCALTISADSIECDLCKGVFSLVDDVVDGNKTLALGLWSIECSHANPL
jgi:hypothetical protein